MGVKSTVQRMNRWSLALLGVGAACGGACGSDGASAPAETAAANAPVDAGGASRTTPPEPPSDAGQAPAVDAGPGCPSTGAWSSLIPGPGQPDYDAALAARVAKHDRLHEALSTYPAGLDVSGLTFTTDTTTRQKLAHLLGTPWDANDADPTDDLQTYEGVDPKVAVTAWQFATGMYAGSAMAADAFRYGVLRDRGGSCNDVARARKMLEVGLDALHVVVTIPGIAGGIARALTRVDLPGDGATPTTPLFDASHAPLPPEKNNGTYRDDNSTGHVYPNLHWVDSCSRDMLFGWTLAMASTWEVIANDPTFDPVRRARLQADARGVLDGLRVVRSSGKDLEIWDPDGRRSYNGNLHETSVDRDYLLINGPSSMMALGEVAGLVSVVGDANAKAYLDSLVHARGLPKATTQSMFVVGLGGDQSNHSAFNMLFMTAWMAHRYIDDAATRTTLKKPTEQDLYAPLVGARPSEWKQSLFDLVVAASSGDAWASAPASSSFDRGALARAIDTLAAFPEAPFYAAPVTNCDASEIALGSCLLNDGVTTVNLKSVKWGLVGDKPVPMKVRPPSNFFWRSDPFVVNGDGDPNVINPAADLRVAYWLGRWVRVAP